MESARKTASEHVARLSESTMRRAWKGTSEDERRRIAVGAVLFGQRLEEKLSGETPKLVYEEDVRRFLMGLLNEVISAFAEAENVSTEEAAAFLGDVTNRDRILEFNEVLDAYEKEKGQGRTLDALLLEAVKSRRDRALWADHWSSG